MYDKIKIYKTYPFNNLYNSKCLKKANSNNLSNKVNKNTYYWNNKQNKKNLKENKSLDSQKLSSKKTNPKINDVSTLVNKNIVAKNKNKILS